MQILTYHELDLKVILKPKKACSGRVRKLKIIFKFTETQYIASSYPFRLLLRGGLVGVLDISMFIRKEGSKNLPRNGKLLRNLF